MSNTDGGDASITATEASVAGSSVAATEAEEDASSYSQPLDAGDNEAKVIVTKSSSLEISIPCGSGKDTDDDEEEDGEYTAPMHLHALRSPAKLKGVRSRSSSRSRPGSRRSSRSPPHAKVGEGEIKGVSPSISVASSLDGISHKSEEFIDPDILLDKLGFRDLDPNITQEQLQELLRKHISSNTGMPTLNERMSEETMDDVHAFQDLQFVKKSKDEIEGGQGKSLRESMKEKGLTGSQIGGSGVSLGALDEEEEDEGDDDDNNNSSDVILEFKYGIMPGGGDSQKRSSTMAVAAASSIDDDVDEDNAEVEVPTSVMRALEVSEGKRREYKQEMSNMAVWGDEPDYLEADEQDGLEADQEDEPI